MSIKRTIAAATVVVLTGATVTNLAACSAVKRLRGKACSGKCGGKVAATYNPGGATRTASACGGKCGAKTTAACGGKCGAKCGGKH